MGFFWTLYINLKSECFVTYLGQDINKENLFNPKQHSGHHFKKEEIDFNVGWKGERKCVSTIRQDS